MFQAFANLWVLIPLLSAELCVGVAILTRLMSVALSGSGFLALACLAFRMRLRLQSKQIQIRWLIGQTNLPADSVSECKIEQVETEDYGRRNDLVLLESRGKKIDLTRFTGDPRVEAELATLKGTAMPTFTGAFSYRQQRERMLVVCCWLLLVTNITLVVTNTFGVVKVGRGNGTSADE